MYRNKISGDILEKKSSFDILIYHARSSNQELKVSVEKSNHKKNINPIQEIIFTISILYKLSINLIILFTLESKKQ